MGSIQHVFSNGIADGTNTEIVRPSDWNSIHNYTLQDAVSLSGNTSGVLAAISSGTLYIAGGNNVTLSQDGNSVTISGPHNTQFLTTAMASNRGSDFVQATAAFAGTSASGTIGSNGISVSIGPYITTAALSGDTTKYAGVGESVGTVAGTDIAITVNTVGVSLLYPKAITTARASTDAVGLNTALTANGVAWTVNSSGLSLNVPAFLTTAMASNRGSDFVNTSAGLNLTNVSATLGSGSISISVNAPGSNSTFQAGVSTGGNTQGQTNVTGINQQLVLVGGNNITLSQATAAGGSATITISGPAMMSAWGPYDQLAPVTNSTIGNSTIYLAPFDLPYQLYASRINFFLSIAFTYSGAPTDDTALLGFGYALYTQGTGTASDRISTVTSYSLVYISGSASSSTRLSVTNYNGLSNVTSHSTSQYGVQNATAGTYLTSSIGGYRVLALPVNMTMTPGRYWLGAFVKSASEAGSLVFAHSVMQIQVSNNIAFRVFGQTSAASNASFFQASQGVGIFSVASAEFPNTIPLTSDSIRAALIVTLPYFNFSGMGTSTNIL